MRDYERISISWKSHIRADQKEIKKRDLGIVIDWEMDEHDTKIYGMDAELFLKHATFTKSSKEKEN